MLRLALYVGVVSCCLFSVPAFASSHLVAGSTFNYANATIFLDNSIDPNGRGPLYASVLQSRVCQGLNLNVISTTNSSCLPICSAAVHDNKGTQRYQLKRNLQSASMRSLRPSGARTASLAGPTITLSISAGCCGNDEGYLLQTFQNATIHITGASERGLLYGIGRLLRLSNITVTQTFFALPVVYALIPLPLDILSYPQYPMRGHEIGYRPKTNAYDAWDVSDVENYIVDLALFGANVIELLPPHTDDDVYSPLFRLNPYTMLQAASALVDKYGLNCSLWYPALYGNYSNPTTYQQALQEWTNVFSVMARLDAVFVPGGDPGGHLPADLITIATLQKQVMRQFHPTATMWIGPQSWNATLLAQWTSLIAQPSVMAVLDGVVYGPWTTVDISTIRAQTPDVYPIRLYPDICHSTTAQFPTWSWHFSFALTQNREVINPRPTQHARIAQLYLPYTIGFGAYNEGINDDFNKILWLVAAWGPDAGSNDDSSNNFDVANTAVTDYAAVFSGGGNFAGVIADILFGLEMNWEDASQAGNNAAQLLQQCVVLDTFPTLHRNWRVQQLLYRCYYDAWTSSRYNTQADAEAAALSVLLQASEMGSFHSINAATAILSNASASYNAPLYAALHTTATRLFALIGMQLSVPEHFAIGTERGANFDLAFTPLNNALYLLAAFSNISALPTEAERVNALIALAEWKNAGPGGFYDDLGVANAQPHLLPGIGVENDPQYYQTPQIAFAGVTSQSWISPNDALGPPPSFPLLPLTSASFIKTMFNTPLQLQYTGLDPTKNYSITLVYANGIVNQGNGPVQLIANDGILVHDWLMPPANMSPVTFAIPPSALASNTTLTLSCYKQWYYKDSPSHSGCAISETWLRVCNANCNNTMHGTAQ